MSTQLYQQKLMEHFKSDAHKGVISSPDAQAEGVNDLCGDTLSMTITVENGIFKDIKFTGSGCILSQAAASMLIEKVIGSSQEQVSLLGDDDMRALVGINLGPNRFACVRLALDVLKRLKN